MRLSATSATIVLLLSCLWTVFVPASAQELPSKWYFGKGYNDKVSKNWAKDGIVATDCGQGILKVVKADGSAPDSSLVIKNKPVAGPVSAGDCLLFEFPKTKLEAGSFVEFDLTFSAEEGAPSEWIFEYFDGDWISGGKYKVYGNTFENSYQATSVLETAQLKNAVDGTLRLRMRTLKSKKIKTKKPAAHKGFVVLYNHAFLGAYVQDLGTVAPKDTLNLLYIGNSFTYYTSSAAMLKEIAWNEGHYIDLKLSIKGGARFHRHLGFAITDDAINKGNYDMAILQEHSLGPAAIGKDKNSEYLQHSKDLAAKILAKSPDCKFLVEFRTSATAKNNFYDCGDMKTYVKYTLKGTRRIAKAIGGEISNISDAFFLAQKERSDFDILAADGSHPSKYGAYLKSCVNYLTIYGKPFGQSPADCGIEPEIAAYLRSVAERVVLKKHNKTNFQ